MKGVTAPSPRALIAVKAIHTVIWVAFVAAIVALPVAAWRADFGTIAGITLLFALEGLALGAFGGHCPLTGVAERLTSERGPNVDIYLPRTIAQYNLIIFGPLLLVGEAAAVASFAIHESGYAAWRFSAALCVVMSATAAAFLAASAVDAVRSHGHLERRAIAAGAMTLVFALAAIVCAFVGGSAPTLMMRAPLAPPSAARFVAATDGTRLFVDADHLDALPGGSPARAAVWVVQGAPAARGPDFPALRSALMERGIGVVTAHGRGTGWSDGPRGDLDRFDVLVDDQLDAMIAAVGSRERPVPLILLGHSAAGAVALELALRAHGRLALAGVVLVNPAVVPRAGGVGPSARDVLSYALHMAIAPAQPIANMNGDPALLHDEDDAHDARQLLDDPLAAQRLSLRLLLSMRAIMQRAPENARALSLPLLIVTGANDEVIDPVSARQIFDRWGGTERSEIVVAGGHGSAVVTRATSAIIDFVERCSADRLSASP